MERVKGVQDRKTGWITRLVFRAMRKSSLGGVPPAKRLLAHHTPTLLAAVGLDTICASAKTVSPALKELVQIKVAVMVGCPY